jgi:hypothetical protein
MKYLKTRLLPFSLLMFLIISCAPSQNIEVSKTANNEGGPRTLVYCLPSTRIEIDVAITKITTLAGPYAAYAEKHLSLTGSPLANSEVFEIAGVKILPVNEPDPDQFYAVTFKNYPSNLDKIFSMTQQGLMLDLEKAWEPITQQVPSKHRKPVMFENTVIEPLVTEDIDTLYKTILTDASFVKVPIYKKSLNIKNEEDKAKDMADLILKIRKRRLKLMMGEYEYHPEGEALKVIVKELNKQEAELMTNFIGKEIRETRHFTYSFTPTSSISKELLWFSEQNGVSEAAKSGFNAVSATFTIKESIASSANVRETENSKSANSIYFRSPVVSQVSVKIGNNVLADAKVPVFQAGKIQQLPVRP